jgi:hypothetical protein
MTMDLFVEQFLGGLQAPLLNEKKRVYQETCRVRASTVWWFRFMRDAEQCLKPNRTYANFSISLINSVLRLK